MVVGAVILLVRGCPLDEEDRGYRCLRSGSYSPLRPPSSPWSSRGLAVEQGIVGQEARRAPARVPGRARTESVNLRDQELQKNFGQRVLVPVVSQGGTRRPTGHAARHPRPDREEDSCWPAAPAGWDAERVMAFKVIGAVVGGVGGLVFDGAGQARAVHLDRRDRLCSRSSGSWCPTPSLNRRVDERQKEILQDAVGHARPAHDQRRSGAVAQRIDRPGGAERARRAVVGVRAHAPGDPAGCAPFRGVPPPRRPHRRRTSSTPSLWP